MSKYYYKDSRGIGVQGSSEMPVLKPLNPCLPAGPEPNMVQGRHARILGPFTE
jgi:hypothetical protein